MLRRLPPLNALRAFEAAARHQGFTRAAEELHVSQGAVSRQVALLEAHLGQKLFIRSHRAATLTPRGRAYAVELRELFDRMEEATRQFSAPHSRTLRVKLPPTFAIRWVIPRLARLHALDRTLDVQITTSHAPVDFEREDIDVAIHSGDPPAAYVSRRLLGETILPACSPAVLANGGLHSPADLAGRILLCSLHRPNDWPRWLHEAGVEGVDGNSGLKFENSSLAYQAAIDNLGIVMAQKELIAEELASGRLVAPLGLEVVTGGAYHIVHPRHGAMRDIVMLFDRWITQEAEAFQAAQDALSRGSAAADPPPAAPCSPMSRTPPAAA